MRYQQTAAPTEEPVTVQDLIAHSQLGELPSDQIITARFMLSAARQWVENRLSRQLVTATWQLHLDRWETEILIANRLPIASISSIQYYDTAGEQQTLAADQYATDTDSPNRPARIKAAYGVSLPLLQLGRYSPITVTFTAGYGGREDVPLGIRHAILMLAGTWYEHRENEVVGTITATINTGVEMCLQPFDWGQYS